MAILKKKQPWPKTTAARPPTESSCTDWVEKIYIVFFSQGIKTLQTTGILQLREF